MKKFLAGLLAAAMVAAPSAAYAENTGAQGIDADVIIGAEVQGTALEGTVNVKQDAEGDTALSFTMGVPAGESSVKVELPDVVRYIGEDIYINAKNIADFYQMMSGDTSIAEVLGMIGVDGWVKISPIAVVYNEEAINSLMAALNVEPSEQLMASFAALGEAFTITETDETVTIPVNNELLINLADKVDELIVNNKEELTGYANLLDVNALLNIVDYRATFGEYVNAYAEGRASVTGEDAAAVSEEIFGMVDQGIAMVAQMASAYTGNISFDQVPDLSDALSQALANVVIDGQVVIYKNEQVIEANVAVTANEQTVDFALRMEITDNGFTCSATAAQGGQILASADAALAVTDNSFDGFFQVQSNGEIVVEAHAAGELTDEALNGLFTLTAEGQTAEFVIEAHPTETGLEGAYSLTFDGEAILEGTITAGYTLYSISRQPHRIRPLRPLLQSRAWVLTAPSP